MKYEVKNQLGEKVTDIELSDAVFGLAPNVDLVHQAVVAQSGNERSVIADTKDRSEVRGGGKKPWRQKGTGRARVGSNRSPIWIGGGVTFGPTTNRNFSKKLNDKMKKKALLMVLSDRALSNDLLIVDQFAMADYKTKDFLKIIKTILPTDQKNSLLIVDETRNEKIKYSANNLKGIEVINLDNLNILDVLKYRNLLLTLETVKILEKRYGKEVKGKREKVKGEKIREEKK